MRLLRKLVKVLAVLVVGLLVVAAAVVWWRDPKRAVDSTFVRARSAEELTRGRRLGAADIDAAARRVLAGMTLEQKVLQMSGDTWLWDFVGERFVGRPWEAGVDRRAGLRPLVFTDGPRGVGLGSSTCFPVPMARAASWDRSLERRVGDAAGREVRGHGADVWLAPCLNLLRHPLWGRAQETYGEDPFLVGEMGAALVEGAQAHNVMACAKHYALNSIEETRRRVDVRVDERTLREVYLPHFRRVVDADVATVMAAYNKTGGLYLGENRHLLREILKDEWGFAGFVMSDWFFAVTETVRAAEAGLDLEMPMVDVFGQKLVRAVEEGRVAASVVDEAVLRLLRRRIDYATRPDPETYGPGVVRAAAHLALAREAAEKGVVLLENRGVLPLDRARVKSLAVIGPLADAENIGDRGSSRVRPAEVVTVLGGLRAAVGPSVPVAHETGADLARARAAAKAADVAVVVVGFTALEEGEYIPEVPDSDDRGGDRDDLGLKPGDRTLVEAVTAENPRSVVVLIGGAAIAVDPWRERVGALLMAFYPGEQGGVALARVLFGDINPSGKLPFTVPKDMSQLPPWDNRSDSVEYGPYHGYTLLDRRRESPTYPFGFGRSYTTYRYQNVALETPSVRANGGIVRVSVDVTNTGPRAGEEVVQLYVGFPSPSAVERPVKLLRAFEKVPLAPGETKTVSLAVPVAAFAYYDTGGKAWVVERAAHTILVGPSSRAEDLLTATVLVVD